MVVVSLTGIDGSGKTTQALMLCRVLQKVGYRTKYLYAGNTGIKLSKKYILYLSLPFDIIVHKVFRMQQDEFYKRFPKIVLIEEFLLFLNYLLLVSPKIWFYKHLYDVVIADRNVYDYIISRIVLYKLNSIDFPKRIMYFLLKILLRYAQKPDLIILLDVDEKIAFARKREKDQYELHILRSTYLVFAQALNWFIVNSSYEKLSTLRQILVIINKNIVKHTKDYLSKI